MFKKKKKKKAVYWGMYLNEENQKNVSKGWISTLGRSVLELRPSAEGTAAEARGGN